MNDARRVRFDVYYEHPDWFRPLFTELDRRGTRYSRIEAAQHHYDATNVMARSSAWCPTA